MAMDATVQIRMNGELKEQVEHLYRIRYRIQFIATILIGNSTSKNLLQIISSFFKKHFS